MKKLLLLLALACVASPTRAEVTINNPAAVAPQLAVVDASTASADTGYFGYGATISTFAQNGSLTLSRNAPLTLSGSGGYITGASSVNASAFFGNGSGLTALTAANITAGGTLPALNGSNLTNLPASGGGPCNIRYASATVTGIINWPSTVNRINFFVVGAGGAGGGSNTSNACSGGGGGGGLVINSSFTVAGSTYALVAIGAGGTCSGDTASGTSGGTTSLSFYNAAGSVIASTNAYGGGGGSKYGVATAISGGSGGGGAQTGSPTSFGYGWQGGNGGLNGGGGGGCGATSHGVASGGFNVGYGGDGMRDPLFGKFYCAGGSGGRWNGDPDSPAVPGGSMVGGYGGAGNVGVGGSAVANTGSGGGGACGGNVGGPGSDGFALAWWCE